MTDTPGSRTPTAVDATAEEHFAGTVRLSPLAATYFGVPGHDEDIDDLSPAGLAAVSEHRRATVSALEGAVPADAVDVVTIAAMKERLGLAEAMYDAGLEAKSLNVLASPLQTVRDTFDLMPTDTDEQWRVLAARLAKVPTALAQYAESLRFAKSSGQVSPQRQVAACVAQCERLVAPDGYFAALVASAQSHSDATVAAVRDGAASAASAYATLGEVLRDELLPAAPESDACGIDTYRLSSQYFLGAVVDLEETYHWGQEELARISADMAVVAERIRPGATVQEAIEILDADPAYRLEGTDALREWMQERADGAIASLADTHFDIPDPIRTIECRIAPTQTGGIYYTGPSDDFSRPGRMWWSVPQGVTTFGTWRELTTVHHEGVPGHHLQVAQAVYRRELLNTWRRLECWVSGHGEGWGLYSERLMADLGYLDDPGNRMGWLGGQSLRAARVVIDIGVHCGFEAPAEVGGGAWTYDKAWTLLTRHAGLEESSRRFELDRYLGWPGQAPSYKIGERLWLQIRDEAAQRAGADFDLKTFHKNALDLGSIGLDVLREAVLG